MKTDLDAEDNAVLLMQYPKAICIAEASWTQIDKATNYHTQIYGTEGTLLAEPENGRLLLATPKNPEGKEVASPSCRCICKTPSPIFYTLSTTTPPFNPSAVPVTAATPRKS